METIRRRTICSNFLQIDDESDIGIYIEIETNNLFLGSKWWDIFFDVKNCETGELILPFTKNDPFIYSHLCEPEEELVILFPILNHVKKFRFKIGIFNNGYRKFLHSQIK